MNELIEFYSRKDIQNEMVRIAKDREIGVRYGDKGFGKRPDMIQFGGDVLDLVKGGATSFHISEERWQDPLQLKTGMTKKQLDDLRIGWDLVIDIDCKELEYSKIAAHLIIQALEYNDVKNISVKYSGNKGLHIAVPFEAFPQKIEHTHVKQLFPDGPKAVALYLGNLIKDRLGQEFINYGGNIEKIGETFGKTVEQLEEYICTQDKVPMIPKLKQDLGLVCPYCGGNEYAEFKGGVYMCPKCNKFMAKTKNIILNAQQLECPICGKKQFEKKFNPFMVLEIDTVLISSRHMFRAPYSYHEKSGLISIPIKPGEVLSFKREQAQIKNVKVEADFLNTKKESDASKLLIESLDWWSKTEKKKQEAEKKEGVYEDIKEAIPITSFPPCVQKILQGLNQDGRKRALFILINFMQNAGWSYESIDKQIREWNKKNYEPIKEGYIISQLGYRTKTQKIMPPNCSNEAYYKDLGVCNPDNLCSMIKNPVQYAIRKSGARNKEEKKKV